MGFWTSKGDIFRDLEILDVEIDKHRFWRFFFVMNGSYIHVECASHILDTLEKWF